MDDKIVVNSRQMREKIWIIRTSQNRTWDGPEDFPNVSALVSGVNLHRAVSYIPCRHSFQLALIIFHDSRILIIDTQIFFVAQSK